MPSSFFNTSARCGPMPFKYSMGVSSILPKITTSRLLKQLTLTKIDKKVINLILFCVSRLALIVIFLSSAGALKAQLLDTLRDFLKHKYSIDVRLESRASVIHNELTSITGVRVGLTFK